MDTFTGGIFKRPFLALGFRPFFLLAGISAVILMALWLPLYLGKAPPPAYYPVLLWHQHEMLFGYAAAVIAGFLLTAVRNWTGLQTLQHGWLAGLVLLWLAARLLPFIPGMASWSIALVDALFLPALAFGLLRPLLAAGQQKNRMMLVVLLVMGFANLMLHLALLGVVPSDTRLWMGLGLHLVVLLMAMIGGRVLPFFTANVVPGAVRKEQPRIERWLPLLLIAWLVSGLFSSLLPWPRALLALTAAVLLALRLRAWYHPGIWRLPILWVLHIGYGWLVLGLLFDALAVLGLVAETIATHAFTVGAIGLMTLGMISRVALGHTGRPIQAAGGIVFAYLAVLLSALSRVAVPLLQPDWSLAAWIVSAALWCLAFALLVFHYTPILLRPRLDGRPD